jgi:phospholipase/carboxylesterase
VIGFSQGAIMSLALAHSNESVASRIVSLSGRFATLTSAIESNTTLHLIHGKSDQVIPYHHCLNTAEQLGRIAADFTADVIPFLGHQINQEAVELLIKRLKNHIPVRH